MAVQHYSTVAVLDAGQEKSSHRIYHGALTATSIAGFLIDWGNYKTALDDIVAGTLHKEQLVMDNTVLSNVPPADPSVQRENKLLITYQGNTSLKKFQLEIPCPDFAALTRDSVGDGVVLADGGVMAAWVTAFETIARTPDDDTETVTVLSARYVGRNI